MRVAIIHYWLLAARGGEKVVQALCELFPEAVVFTHVSDEKITRELFPGREIQHSFISRLPMAQKLYQKYLPLMPLALEEIDLSEFDLVISSESGPAKGVIPMPGARHICYCHSPMRYLWDQRHLYRRNAPWFQRSFISLLSHPLRQWDVTTAHRVDDFVANSHFVASRIEKYYRRDASVIHPPVDVESFAEDEDLGLDQDSVIETTRDAYLWVGQLISYKRPDLAIQAFTKMGKPIAVIGEGDQLPKLKAMAGPNVRFLGRVGWNGLRTAYRHCRALIFPGEEDFGIVPVEAMASGKPVIAYARGGALETVVADKTGVFFDEQSVDSLIDAVTRFEKDSASFDPAAIRAHAATFSKDAFKEKFMNFTRERTRDLDI